MNVVNKHEFDFDTVINFKNIVRDTKIPHLKRFVAQYTNFQKRYLILISGIVVKNLNLVTK